MRHAMIVLDPIRKQEFGAFFTGFPPRRYTSTRWLPAEIGKHAEGFVKDVFLLLECHVCWVFVRVAVETNLVAGVTDHGAFFGEGFKGMAGDDFGVVSFCFGRVFDWRLAVVAMALSETGMSCPCSDTRKEDKNRSQTLLTPGSFHIILFEEFEKTSYTNCSREDALFCELVRAD